MNRRRTKKEKEYSMFTTNISPYQRQCKNCGRKRIVKMGRDRVLCDWCGHYIYKSDEIEFKYKMMEAIRK